MKPIVVIGVLVASVALQSSLLGMRGGGTLAINLVLVAVVYLALIYGPATGTLAGTVGGLVQDTIGGGIIGIGGLSKTLVGFLAGVLGAQFNLTSTVPRLVMFMAASLVHQVVFEVLHGIVDRRAVAFKMSAALTQAVLNGLIGVTAFLIVEKGPESAQRWRMNRASLSKRRF